MYELSRFIKMQSSGLIGLVNRFGRPVTTPDGVDDAIDDFVQYCGCPWYIWSGRISSVDAPPVTRLASRVPEEWLFRLSEESDLQTLFERRRHLSAVPFVWSQVAQIDNEARRFMNLASQCGLSDGLFVPVHGARSSFGSLTLVFDHHVSPERLAEISGLAFVFAAHALQALDQCINRGRSAESLLSRSQIAVLECVSRGLSHKEVARELQIAPGTVKKHMQNAKARLGFTHRRMPASLLSQVDLASTA